MVRGKLVGDDKVLAAFEVMALEVKGATPDAVRAALERVQRQQRALLSMGWHPPRTKTGSVSPEPPWRISGWLSRSVKVSAVYRHGLFSYRGKTGPTAVYGRIQEKGGWTGRGHRTFLPPRPSLEPAWRIVKSSIHPMFRRVWERATRPPRL